MFFTLTSLHALIIDADDFAGRPQILAEIINTVNKRIEVALVTRRNWIASAPPVRTFHPIDMTEHLDFKNLLTRIIQELKVPPSSTVFLCSSTLTFELAKELLLGSIVFPKQPLTDIEKHLLYQESPDFVVDSLDALYKCLSIQDTGYAAEVASAPDRLVTHPVRSSSLNTSHFTSNTQLSSTSAAPPPTSITPSSTTSASPPPCSTNPTSTTPTSPTSTSKQSLAFIDDQTSKPTTRIVKLPNLQHSDCPYFVLGRYFGPSDPRHKLHALSLRLSHFKHHHTPHAQLFSELYLGAIDAATSGDHDLITQVPSRPEAGDRLAHILTLMQTHSARLSSIYAAQIQPDLLRCVKSYPPLKGLNLVARKASIAKVFQVQKDIQGKRIVLIDDIVTTGATINACITELKGAGAASVTAVLLAYHPYALKARPDPSTNSCTKCGESLRITFDASQLYFECLRQMDKDNHSKISFNDAISKSMGFQGL